MPTSSLNIFGSFTGTGVSDATQSMRAAPGAFNFGLSGTWVGTVELQREFEEDGVWHTVDSPFTGNDQLVGHNAGHNVSYRFECTAFTSGEIVFKANQ